MEYKYVPEGVCSSELIFQIEDDIVKDLKIVGGCPGNTVGISKLVQNKKIDEIIELLIDIPCGYKGTSCPDQIAKALIEYKNNRRDS
ncbi:MAG: TIGR03905 family TSCPD domain-containing protein [Clostridia bacterium]|nr:TIGR03905 family TSCPD domain-containing protein [Clostridia bacterium]